MSQHLASISLQINVFTIVPSLISAPGYDICHFHEMIIFLLGTLPLYRVNVWIRWMY